MPISLGSGSITKLMLGTTAVTRVMLGTTQVWAPALYTSIQPITGTIGTLDDSVDVTISSVDTALTTLMWRGQTGTSDLNNTRKDNWVRAQLINSTTVRFTRGNVAAVGAVSCAVTVIEWSSDWIDTIQRGTIAITNAATSNTATITSIDTSRSYVSLLGFSSNSTSASNYSYTASPVVVLTNSTTITATTNALESSPTAETITISYEAVQFKAAKVRSIQYAEFSGSSGTDLTKNVTISSVTPGDCMLIPNGQYMSSTGAARWFTAELQSATNVRFTRGTASSLDYKVGVTVVELIDTFAAVENISDSGYVTSATTKDVTITTLDPAKSFLTYQGYNITASVDAPHFLSTVVYKDADEATLTRVGTTALTGGLFKARSHTFI